MKKFTVKPRLFSARIAIAGAQGNQTKHWAYLGRLGETGQLTDVRYDLDSPHVVAIFGKRGSGKSYTMGSILESLCTKEQKTSIGDISREHGILLFDTLGIFQWVDILLKEDSNQETIKSQYAIRRGWDLKPEPLDVQIWIPMGTGEQTTPASHTEFAVNSSDFSASDWGYLLGLDIYQDRMGQLLNDAYAKVTSEGWNEGGQQHSPQVEYNLADLITCIGNDSELVDAYQSETRRAVLQQLNTFRRNPLFQDRGTSLRDLLQPGRLSVIVMNRMTDELRLVVLTALIRRIIKARIEASESEKHLKILENLPSSEEKQIKSTLSESIPPSWVAIDEAQNILPSERKTTATDMLIKFVREGRNYGLSFMVATQQPAAIDQRILAQVDTIMTHKLTVQSDIDYVKRNLKSNLPSDVTYANRILSFDELVRSLDIGQAFISNTETDRGFIMDIRPRISVHGGFS